jgi:hypothetical protein
MKGNQKISLPFSSPKQRNMKKILVGSLVGGLLLFIWQTLSWMVMDLHAKAHSYTDNQQAVIDGLSTQLPAEGTYMIPGPKPGTTMEEHQKVVEAWKGKPWAMITYHKSFEINMVSNIIRGFLVNVILMALFCWILSKIAVPKFGTVFLASIFTGLIVFLNGIYTGHIWYPTFDLMAHLTDAIAGWGLAGLWLGWWYSKK